MAVQQESMLIDLIGFAKGGVQNPEYGHVAIVNDLLQENVAHQGDDMILLYKRSI